MQNDNFVGLLHSAGNRCAIERRNRSQVQDFDFDSLFTQNFRGFESRVQHGSVSNHTEMMAFSRDFAFPRGTT